MVSYASQEEYVLITIKVTAEHISRGVRNSPCQCPIAQAIKDTIRDHVLSSAKPQAQMVFVHNWAVTVRGASKVFCPILPSVAQQFIDRFDTRSSQVVPFEFELELDLNEL